MPAPARPRLTVFNHPRAVLGIPLLVFYLLAVWLGIVGILESTQRLFSAQAGWPMTPARLRGCAVSGPPSVTRSRHRATRRAARLTAQVDGC